MKRLTTMAVLLAMTLSLSGCSRFRQLTRRDYAHMDDPFAEPLVDDSRYASESEPTMTASQSRVMSAQGDSANATSGVRSATLTRDAAESARSFVRGVQADASEAFGSAEETTRNPFAEAAGSQDMSQFLSDQANASGLTETAQQLDAEFASWAAEQNQEWKREANDFSSGTADVVGAIEAIPDFVENAREDLSQFAIEPLEDDVATPFIQRTAAEVRESIQMAPDEAAVQQLGSANPFAQTAGRVTLGDIGSGVASAAAASSRPETTAPEWPAAAETQDWQRTTPGDPTFGVDPFVNPFVDEKPTPQAAPKRPVTSPSLDSRFNFDTGWRPSSVERP